MRKQRIAMAVAMGCMAMMAFGGTAQACGDYDQVLNQIKYDEGKDCSYACYDMNDDGMEELIVLCGTCEADYQYRFYTMLSDGSIYEMGSLDGGHASLYESQTSNGIYVVKGQMGWEQVTEVSMAIFTPTISADVLYEREGITSYTDYYQNDYPIELTTW